MKTESIRGLAVLSDFYFWAWGLDLRKSNRELFLSYGFRRIRPPSRAGSRSMYVLELMNGRFICFWPFGFLYSKPGYPSLFHKRGTARGRLIEPVTSVPDVYIALEDLQFLEKEKDQISELWTEVVSELEAFESWIAARCGHEYRANCFREWKDPEVSFDLVLGIKKELLNQLAKQSL